MWNKIKLATLALMITTLIGCKGETPTTEKLKVGTIAGPESELMEVAKGVAKNKYNLDIEIVQFQDYVTPNTALADGALDANAFQTIQFLDKTVESQKYKLVSVGKTFIYPMGLYSRKINTLADFPQGASVAIPNDPSNEERALLLLEKAGLIKLKTGTQPLTVNDIAENPLELKITTLDAAQLPRSLDDVLLAAINTNYAVGAGFHPTEDALYLEGSDSPYANIIATREELAHDPRILHLVVSYQSPEVIMKAEELFKGQAIPAWVTEKK
jgi:D-methionine transport system substrate-binding protein